MIEIIEPKMNKQGGKLKHATGYYQYVDDKENEVSNLELLNEPHRISEKLAQQE